MTALRKGARAELRAEVEIVERESDLFTVSTPGVIHRKPFYESDLATLYVGDAREILPTLPRDSVDLLVTDPPYGVGWYSGNHRKVPFDRIVGDDGSLDVPAVLALVTAGVLRNHRHVYVFGYDAEALREPLRLSATMELIWDKGGPGLGNLRLPWGPSHERLTFGVHTKSPSNRRDGHGRLAARLRAGSVLRVPKLHGNVLRHPTEKPVALMRLLIESSSLPGELVLDPFAGVGSTLVAAIVTGRRAIGIEIDKRYAEIAAERLRKAEAIAREIARL